MLLMRTQQRILDNIENELKKAGLPLLSWYDVLLELSRDPGEGLRQFEIGERVLLNKHNLSRLIDRLEQEGLLNRQNCETDGRGVVVRITPRGGQLIKKMWPVYARAMQKFVGEKLTNVQAGALIEILAKLTGQQESG